MCKMFEEEFNNDPDWIDNAWFSDKANFQLKTNINSKNCRIWSKTIPYAENERPLHGA